MFQETNVSNSSMRRPYIKFVMPVRKHELKTAYASRVLLTLVSLMYFVILNLIQDPCLPAGRFLKANNLFAKDSELNSE